LPCRLVGLPGLSLVVPVFVSFRFVLPTAPLSDHHAMPCHACWFDRGHDHVAMLLFSASILK
jgi:hypothetical protein